QAADLLLPVRDASSRQPRTAVGLPGAAVGAIVAKGIHPRRLHLLGHQSQHGYDGGRRILVTSWLGATHGFPGASERKLLYRYALLRRPRPWRSEHAPGAGR